RGREIVPGPPLSDGFVPEYRQDPVRRCDRQVRRASPGIELGVEDPLICVGIGPPPRPRHRPVVLDPDAGKQWVRGAAVNGKASWNESLVERPLVFEIDRAGRTARIPS